MAEEESILAWSCALDGDRAFVSLRGELDLAAAPHLRDAVVAAAGARSMVVDIEDVTFMDGGGLDALMRFTQHVADVGMDVRFGPAPRAVSRYLALTGSDPL